MGSYNVLVYIVQVTYIIIALSWFIELHTRDYSITITYTAEKIGGEINLAVCL